LRKSDKSPRFYRRFFDGINIASIGADSKRMNAVVTLMSPAFRLVLGLAVISTYFISVNAQDARSVAKQVFPSVVMLDMQDASHRPLRFGSGFFVRPNVIATNYHVIENAAYGVAKVAGETQTYAIEGTIGIDKANDLVLLKLVDADRPALTLADIGKIEVGEEIFAFGNPKRLEGTISPGIISGLSLREMAGENLIQISAPISTGSSGGPVVNRNGEVIGVAVSSLTGGQNLNFAVPSSLLAKLMAGATGVSRLTPSVSAAADSPGAKPPVQNRTRDLPAKSSDHRRLSN
jgi:S1-C subfamily serine protease